MQGMRGKEDSFLIFIRILIWSFRPCVDIKHDDICHIYIRPIKTGLSFRNILYVKRRDLQPQDHRKFKITFWSPSEFTINTSAFLYMSLIWLAE